MPRSKKTGARNQKAMADKEKALAVRAVQNEQAEAAREAKKELKDAARAAKKDQENAARAAKKEQDKAARDARQARREQRQDGQPSLEEEERTIRRINLPPTTWNDLLNHCARVVHSMSLASPSDNVTARTVKAFGKAVAARWSGYVSYQLLFRSFEEANREGEVQPMRKLAPKLEPNVEFTFDELEGMLFAYAGSMETYDPKCKKVRDMVLRTIQQIKEVKSGVKKEEDPKEPCLSSPDPRMTRAMSREPKTEEPEEIGLTHIDRLVDGDILADITLLLAEYKKTLVRLLVPNLSLRTNSFADTRPQSNDGKDFTKLDTVMNSLWKCPPAPSFDPKQPPRDLDEFKARIAPWVPKAVERLSRATTRYEASLDAVVGSLLACNFTAEGGFSLRAQWKLNEPLYACADTNTVSNGRDSLEREVSGNFIIPEFVIMCVDDSGKIIKIILVVEDKRTASPILQLRKYALWLAKEYPDVVGLGCRLAPATEGDGVQALICRSDREGGFGLQYKTSDDASFWYSITDDFILETLFDLCVANWRLADTKMKAN
ncbi:uncharacterized protein BXZ73DRAFT_76129 [Epithele typhae]|uniref:uncharacterized protein n=1 Tax=Epithele typhae TaxID=378194 RepID=UPI0020077DFE|nr:uncharacterized protein BXZ73DRAFT_76129 [Epithele typhae]KAH9938964.1 hypothetical protein BXZ73DRAFT_76129 [Epithele typhae]